MKRGKRRWSTLLVALTMVASACSLTIDPLDDPGIGESALTTIVYAADGSVLTAHSLNPVPFVAIGRTFGRGVDTDLIDSGEALGQHPAKEGRSRPCDGQSSDSSNLTWSCGVTSPGPIHQGGS